MLLEMDNKLEQIQKEFKLKLKNAKKNLEKNFNKIKESKDTEIEKLKQIIKDLNEEIQDYKSQIGSLEYKAKVKLSPELEKFVDKVSDEWQDCFGY